jgi:uncharacterized membrane protein
MSNIVVLAFKNKYEADGVLSDILQMQEEGLIELEDAVVATTNPAGQIEIAQTHKTGGKKALKGAGIGLLAGILLGGPIGGLVAGAAIGGISSKMKDYGLDDNFIKSTSRALAPNSSALFLLIKEAKAQEVLDRINSEDVQVLSTSLPPDKEKLLRQALEK